jgi:hypothetical protein
MFSSILNKINNFQDVCDIFRKLCQSISLLENERNHQSQIMCLSHDGLDFYSASTVKQQFLG